MKKAIEWLVGVAIIAVVAPLIFFVACSDEEEEEIKIVEISTREELYAMESDKGYILTADIDLGGGEWKPLSVKSFDGNGHTIENGVIKENYSDDYGAKPSAAFFYGTQVSNVAFKEIIVSAINAELAAIAVAGYGDVSNVTLEDCRINYTYNVEAEKWYDTDEICIGLVSSGYNKFFNCTVRSCSLTVAKAAVALQAGFICGRDFEAVDSCTVEDCDMTIANAENVYIGGLVGLSKAYNNVIKNCSVKNNRFKVENSGYTMFGGLCSYAGEDEDGEFVFNKVTGNNVEIKTDDYCCGGLFGGVQGKISDCLVSNNIISARASDEEDVTKRLAGAIGYCVESATVRNCVVQNCSLDGDGVMVGFIGDARGSVVSCAVRNNQLTGDAFARERDNIAKSYIFHNGDGEIDNVNKLPTLNEEEWKEIIAKLEMKDCWSVNSAGELVLSI
ncbi:MAG: hypothetical protein IJX49_03065 [Clostridia bacterium]|nr:hypothetical protein [Clostridia bacterium]